MVIGAPELVDDGNDVIARAKYTLNDRSDHLWFSFPSEYREYIVTERADAFLVGLLLLAMKHGEDIQLEVPVSARLHYGLTHYLTTAIHLTNREWQRINVTPSRLDSEDLNRVRVAATGLSCGVDSFSTVCEHADMAGEYKIGYFTFFNAGSHGSYGGDLARKLFLDRLRLVRAFADENGIPVIPVDSNINETLGMEHLPTFVIRDIACMLNLQKLIRNYYFTTSYRFDSTWPLTSASRNLLARTMLSTESTTIYPSASQYSRVERTALISDYEPTYRYLNVCVSSQDTGIVQNCSACHKCMRTQLALELLGKLELYTRVFDIDLYRRNRTRFIGWTMLTRKKDPLSRELMDLLRERKRRIPALAYLYCIPIAVDSAARNLVRGMRKGRRPLRGIAELLYGGRQRWRDWKRREDKPV